VLPESGIFELEAIARRYPFMAGDFREEDLFSSYMSDVRPVQGDPSHLLNVDPDERLAVAHRLSAEWDPDSRMSWTAYCSIDPVGAFETLRNATFDDADPRLWIDLIGILAWGAQSEPDVQKARREELVERLFDGLECAPASLLHIIKDRLIDLLPIARSADMPSCDAWWDRLWQIVEQQDESPVEFGDGDSFYSSVMGHPAGRLAEHLLVLIDKRKKSTKKVSRNDIRRLRNLLKSDRNSGWLARGVCARNAGFVLYIDPKGAREWLRIRIAADNLQGKTLRSVLVERAELGSEATLFYKKDLLRGVVESGVSNEAAANVASKILRPLIHQRMTGEGHNWGLDEDEVRDALRCVADPILEGAAHCLKSWVNSWGPQPEIVWCNAIRPVFEAVWPKERKFKRPQLTRDLAALCVGARRAFPEALELVRHYLSPFDGEWVSVHFLASSDVPQQHPDAVLDLLWIVCGPGSRGQSIDLGKILDRLIKANASLEVDRRFQWLEQQCIRFN
jgi:hypothetical protein